jgi:inner membrane protein
MIGKSHVTFGLGSYLLVGALLSDELVPLREWLLYTPLAIVGSLFPDLDHHNSRIKRNFLIKIATIPLTMLGHRTWSHSLTIVAAMLALTLVLPEQYHLALIAFLIGYVSHIVGDWMTPAGVPLFWPLKTKFRSPLNFRTGSMPEYPFALLPLLVTIIFFHSNFTDLLYSLSST